MPKPRRYPTASDDLLRQWAEAGDLLAVFERHHRQTIAHMVQDLKTNPPTAVGPPEYVIYLSEKLPLRFQKASWVTLSILLDERPSKQTMITHWPDIQAWEDRLERWQGPRSGQARYLANMLDWHQVYGPGQPYPYDTLAQWMNTELTGALETFFEIMSWEARQGRALDIEGLLALPSWQLPAGGVASDLKYAVWMMEMMGFLRDDIRSRCADTLENLKEGRPAFLPKEPISRQRIIDRLRRYSEHHPS